MPRKRGLNLLLAACAVTLLLEGAPALSNIYDLPPVKPPEEYGNLLINRTSTAKGVKPVTFSHWQHRIKYTCRVCHTELEFNMELNTTEITEAANQKGKFCGACHNGTTAFGLTGTCEKCHNGDIRYASAKFVKLNKLPLVGTSHGDGINWSESLKRGIISPATYLNVKPKQIPFDKVLQLDAEWSIISPAIFPHKEHNAWLDCSNCHPGLFNIKKKTTKHFSMASILKGEFCGVCHLNVAFPMNDCARCHPGFGTGDGKSGTQGRR